MVAAKWTPPRIGPDGLTDRQRVVYETVRSWHLDHGGPPTPREVMAAVGIGSPNGMTWHLRELVRKGKLRRASKGPVKGVYYPADPEVDVTEPAPGTVRVSTTGPVTMTRAEWRAWLEARLGELGPG